MSWAQPEAADTQQVAALADDPTQAELLTLAEALAPALRAEPGLIRAARLALLPASTVDIEGELLFSDLAASTGARELVFPPGVARVLAGRLLGDPQRLATARSLIELHSRHWHPLDSLGQTLHFAILDADEDAARAGLRSALRLIVDAGDDDERHEIANWLRTLLPGYSDALGGLQEYDWLLRYAALASDDSGGLLSRATRGETPLPAWLAEHRPQAEAVTVSLRWYPGWLAGGPPGSGDHDIPLPGDAPSPVQLRFPDLPGEPARWVPLGPASLIEAPSAARRLELQTLTGQCFSLYAESVPAQTSSVTAAPRARTVRLLYAPEDHEAARQTAALLAAHGITAIPSPVAAEHEVLSSAVVETAADPVVIRLWSRAAQVAQPSGLRDGGGDWRGLVVRLDETPVPGGSARVSTLDLPGLRDVVTEAEQAMLASALDTLLAAGEPPPNIGAAALEQPDGEPVGWDAVIVHAPTDRRRAREMIKRLADFDLRFTAVGDLTSTPAGSREATLNLLQSAPVLVPLLSTATEDNFFAAEMQVAASRSENRSGPSIVPVRRASVPVPRTLEKLLVFDLLEGSDEEWRRLVETLRPLARLGNEEAEIAALLEELLDPATEPPRRLAIGDRLDELGDPRPGVGVVEHQFGVEEPHPVEAEGSATGDPGDSAPSVDEAAGNTTPNQPYPGEVQRLLDEVNNPTTEPPRRLEIGDELERLGDPRPGVGLRADGLPDIAWMEIPAGSFAFGDYASSELSDFRIARYPVTNRQYQAFVDDGGYEDGDWWVGLPKPEPEKPRWPQGNRPRTNVDWREAVAFCRWLSIRLVGEEDAVRLPTEVEWEMAAMGVEWEMLARDDAWSPRNARYPWGAAYRSGFANVDEKTSGDGEWYLQQTTAVGMYPHGASPRGVEDLSGTVWEWCLNTYGSVDKYGSLDDVTVDGNDVARALRGGSWVNNPRLARAARRDRVNPDYRGYSRGFRVLSSVLI